MAAVWSSGGSPASPWGLAVRRDGVLQWVDGHATRFQPPRHGTPASPQRFRGEVAGVGTGSGQGVVRAGAHRPRAHHAGEVLLAPAGNGRQTPMTSPEELLEAAEKVIAILSRHRVDAVVIGAAALAAHHYVRQTEDLDLGVNAELKTLRAVCDSLRLAGFAAELREPDGTDPLGGVIDVSGPFGLVQIISYAGRFPAVIEDAVRSATLVVRQGSPLRITPLPQLIALKLYAGGHKSKADIVELLVRNPGLNLEEVRAACGRYLLEGLEELIAESGSA